MQIRDEVEGLWLSRFLPAPRVFISAHANTGKTFSIAFENNFPEQTAKLFVKDTD